ncbi:MAG TPA: hypothetical protein VFL76_04125 [Edaphocola sp.]|nr:hypothetical protein [Edaphocola sp.]
MEDTLTEAFILKSTEVKHSSIDTALINSVIADDTITESEMEELASSLGFDSEDQFF